MPGYPYTSWIALVSMAVVILSMPFISGQASGLIAGVIMVVLYACIYAVIGFMNSPQRNHMIFRRINFKRKQSRMQTEFSKELTDKISQKDKNKKD